MHLLPHSPLDPDAIPNPNPPCEADQPDIVEQVQIAANADGPLEATTMIRSAASTGSGWQRVSTAIRLFTMWRSGKGTNQVIRRFELRGRSPILYGDLVTLHRPTITPGNTTSPNIRFRGNVNVKGRTVLWRPDMIDYDSNSLYSARTPMCSSRDDYGDHPINNSLGDRVRPSNFPFKPISAGTTAAGEVSGFDGRLSTVENVGNPINTLFERIGGVGGTVGRVDART